LKVDIIGLQDGFTRKKITAGAGNFDRTMGESMGKETRRRERWFAIPAARGVLAGDSTI